MASLFNIRDIGPDDYIVVTAPKDDNDPYYFNIPLSTVKVWVARVKKKVIYNKQTQEYHLEGWFAKNATRRLTNDLVFDNYVDSIDFKEAALVGVYEKCDTLEFDEDDIKELRKNINSM
jgi:hypothetical protein